MSEKTLPTSPNALQELDVLLQDTTTSIPLDDLSIDDDFDHISFDQVDDHILAFQEDEIVSQALANEMDLREYAQQIAKEKVAVQRDLENNYVEHVQSFVDLYNQVQSCDEVLGRMEELLNVFQTDLGHISSEIQNLQEQSTCMNIKLKNRKTVEARLGKALQGMVIPPDAIRKLTEDEVDAVWLEYLLTINKQMRFVKANQHRPIKALENVGPELEKLRLKAVSTIRDFFVSRIQLLCIPNANIQIMQQSVFLKYKQMHYFVLERHHEAAREIKQTYLHAMTWYFQNHFERYSKGLQRLQTVSADKSDLIGVEENARKGGGLFGMKTLKDKTNLFSLADRSDTLRMQDPGVILVHVAEAKDQRYQFEQLFRSFNLTLIDNASSEYLFLYEFFSRDTKTASDTAKSMFQQIFAPTEKVGLQFTKAYIENSFDAVGILLCIRINTQLALELQRRRVPALEGYTNATNMLLWPRFQSIMSLHVESLKKMFHNKSVISAVKDIHPHYITRRYAEFAASLLVLNDGYDDPILSKSVKRLRDEFEAVLSRMSHEFQESTKRIAFLINNYDLIMSVFQETHSRAVEGEVEYMKQLLALQTSAFVDEQLKPYFGTLVDMVKRTDQSSDFLPQVPDLERIAAHFGQTWRQSLKAINGSVIQYFSNFKNGTTVLHAVLGQLIVYYTKFIRLLEDKNLLRIQPVGVQTVMVEIKKYRSTF
ncbi:Vacuolar protein sorting-associated protein 52 A [Choanephora cucurbitarum]|uniref:Vacuolar protein sorting-associated protein 52 A n=1 Tax=Choanephora cucurbitarum TaxID=101091 RepID=A0A1C7NDD0_9FUNG|nr:Vacuolar protein sorting-associated protein 52 A [Choanephora cucurbitarum]